MSAAASSGARAVLYLHTYLQIPSVYSFKISLGLGASLHTGIVEPVNWISFYRVALRRVTLCCVAHRMPKSMRHAYCV